MAGATKELVLASEWETLRLVMTGSAQKISAPAIPNFNLKTIMIQGKFTNAGPIYFADASNVDAGVNAGGELSGGMTAVLPLQDVTNSELYVKGTSGDVLYISFFDGGLVC